MIECSNRGQLLSEIVCPTTGVTRLFACGALGICSESPKEFRQRDGSPVALCIADCPKRAIRVANPRIAEKAPTAKTAAPSPIVYLEPVGDKLHELLKECGINRPVCGECARWRKMMNEWGVTGCGEHRPEIIERLDKEAKAGTWLEAIKVASGGYFSTTALLNEAIRRAIAPSP